MGYMGTDYCCGKWLRYYPWRNGFYTREQRERIEAEEILAALARDYQVPVV